MSAMRVFEATSFDPETIKRFLKDPNFDVFLGKDGMSRIPRIVISSEVFDFSKTNEFSEKGFKKIDCDGVVVVFKQCTFNGTLKFHDSDLERIEFEHCSFTEDDFINNTKKINSIELVRMNIDSFVLEKTVVDAPIVLQYVDTKEIEILSSIFSGGIDLKEVSGVDTKIKIRKIIGNILLPNRPNKFISTDNHSLPNLIGEQNVLLKIKQAR